MAGCMMGKSSRTLRRTLAGLTMLLVSLVAATQVFSEMTWTERTGAGALRWTSIASSSDGMRLAAVDFNSSGYIYTSTDRGATWTKREGAGSALWNSIASSSDGTKLVVGGQDTYIYTSSDGGATWSAPRAGQTTWLRVTSSADGSKLAAVSTDSSGGYIYTSGDSGVTWNQHTSAGKRLWYSIASSADGSKLAAVDSDDGYVYTSTDSGANWAAQTNSGTASWNAIASSSNGAKLAAVVDPCDISTSVNYGVDWSTPKSLGPGVCYSIASSSDGTTLAVAANSYTYSPGDTYVYVSTDSGATWTAQTSAGVREWYSVASSGDGTKLAAGVWDGYIYTGESPTSIDLISFKAVPTVSNVLLKWQTGSEIDTAGFQLWRADGNSGEYSRITRSLIPGKGDEVTGASYSYKDPNVNLGERYFYKLEDVDQNGAGTFHGPVSATAGSIRLIAPGNKARVAFGSAPHFKWKSIPYDHFRLQLSNRSDFKSGIVNLSGDAKWIGKPSYTPKNARWKQAASLAGSEGTIYWRVLGKDPAGGEYISNAFELVVGK